MTHLAYVDNILVILILLSSFLIYIAVNLYGQDVNKNLVKYCVCLSQIVAPFI